VVVTGGEHLFHVEVQIRERCDVQLEELPSTFVASEGSRKGIGLPGHLRVKTLDVRFDVVRIPSGEELANDVEMVLSRHTVLLLSVVAYPGL
jgi:hypothetical protein